MPTRRKETTNQSINLEHTIRLKMMNSMSTRRFQSGLPVWQHYKVAMSAHCRKSVLVFLWPSMLLWCKTNNKASCDICVCRFSAGRRSDMLLQPVPAGHGERDVRAEGGEQVLRSRRTAGGGRSEGQRLVLWVPGAGGAHHPTGETWGTTAFMLILALLL